MDVFGSDSEEEPDMSYPGQVKELFGDSDSDEEFAKDIQRYFYNKRCIPEEFMAITPTISDQVMVQDFEDLEEKTIRQHLEPNNKVIFMNESKNQFVAYDLERIKNLINIPEDERNEDARSGVFFKCNNTGNYLNITPNEVDYETPYFDLRSIGFIPGGYVDLKCFEKALNDPRRVFMIVMPKVQIPIDPVANELAISTHKYEYRQTKTKVSLLEGRLPEVINSNTQISENLNRYDLPIEMFAAAHCQAGQKSYKVFMIPVDVKRILARQVFGSSSSESESEAESILMAGKKRERRKTLRKKTMLKKRRNKTKRRKSKKLKIKKKNKKINKKKKK